MTFEAWSGLVEEKKEQQRTCLIAGAFDVLREQLQVFEPMTKTLEPFAERLQAFVEGL